MMKIIALILALIVLSGCSSAYTIYQKTDLVSGEVTKSNNNPYHPDYSGLYGEELEVEKHYWEVEFQNSYVVTKITTSTKAKKPKVGVIKNGCDLLWVIEEDTGKATIYIAASETSTSVELLNKESNSSNRTVASTCKNGELIVTAKKTDGEWTTSSVNLRSEKFKEEALKAIMPPPINKPKEG